MREQKKHWRQCHVIGGERHYPPVAVCGTWYPKQYAIAKATLPPYQHADSEGGEI